MWRHLVGALEKKISKDERDKVKERAKMVSPATTT